MDDLTPLGAVTAPDPGPYYARLAREQPFAFDPRLDAWVAASGPVVETVLAHASLGVRPVDDPIPSAFVGTALGRTYARLARFTDGPYHDDLHDALRAALVPLAGYDAAATVARIAAAVVARGRDDAAAAELAAFVVPATALGALVGMARADAGELADLARALACALRPGAPSETVAGGARAAERLEALAGRARWLSHYGVELGAARANAAGLFFQAYDATAGLIGSVLARLRAHSPSGLARYAAQRSALARIVREVALRDGPVHNTRRFAATDTVVGGRRVCAGESVLVVLAAANRDACERERGHVGASERTFSFGSGRHACPGADIAMMLTVEAVGACLRAGLDLRALAATHVLASPNIRVPVLAASEVERTPALAG